VAAVRAVARRRRVTAVVAVAVVVAKDEGG
jgi:hypothetical protein